MDLARTQSYIRPQAMGPNAASNPTAYSGRRAQEAVARQPSLYDKLDLEINAAHATALGFTQLAAASAYSLSDAYVVAAERRHESIRRFFEAATDVFAAALAGELPRTVLELLLNETPPQYGQEFHRRMLDIRRTVPQFFRTDEVAPGRIVEIQCPGSLWGEYEVLARLQHGSGGNRAPSLARAFVEQAAAIVGEDVRVHHLLDNASAPHTMRYFIDCTRPSVRYFGIDPGIDQMSCGLVRSHSFFGMTSENFFKPRLERYLAGELLYDLPPSIIFDQKITLALPFMEVTRAYFPEEVREMLIYSAVVTPDGFVTEEGEQLSLEAFAAQPRSERRWFLKYAGSDVSINWGSRAVFTLDNMGREACLQRLRRAAEDGMRGKIWIVQPQEQLQEEVELVEPNGDLDRRRCTAKFNNFYGPHAYLGTLVMHRAFYKVHGQRDTVLSVGLR